MAPVSFDRVSKMCIIRSVKRYPGATLFTRMLSRPTSSARLLAKATAPMRVTPDVARLSMGWYTELARMLTIRPHPLSFIWGTASRLIRMKNMRAMSML